MNWFIPPTNVEEIDQRIKEITTIMLWISNASGVLQSSIAALEMQKAMLTTASAFTAPYLEIQKAMLKPWNQK
jgi:hypothetical protein